MTSQLTQLIRSHCEPLYPIPTGVAPSLKMLTGIRAVLFDIYGTLLISASGDIGTDAGEIRNRAVGEITKHFGLRLNCGSSEAIATLEQRIQHEHQRAKESGVPYPEVEIRNIWASVLEDIVDGDSSSIDVGRFALEYELRVNPTWPMPDAASTLRVINNAGMVLGVVSNAQFFTPLLFPALLDQTLIDLGFDPNLSYFSYEQKHAKPGSFLFDIAKRDLAGLNVLPHEVLYIGNDMLNDVTAAASVGYRTALFAGDRRSLRLRTNDDRVHGVEADIVVTELPQIVECLPIY